MPAIVLLGILMGVGLTFAFFALMFFSVAFEPPPVSKVQELTKEQAHAWFRRVSNNHIDPADCGSPTFGELLKRASLEDLREVTSRSTVS